ncbi:MAG: DUF2313 domain-containing protein [Geobacteraceae bacterium]|nr:DUF2313 domain-containing protein [Geobacteraceae bacterium]
MLHRDVLRLLSPIDLQGAHQLDLSVEGAALDRSFNRVNDLLFEMFPDTSSELISRWEQRYGLISTPLQTLQQRRNLVIARIRYRGSLCQQFYITIAASLGYNITIDENFLGDRYAWRVTVSNTPIYEFYVEDSCCEELLLDWDEPFALEGVLQDLKPADTQIIFAYA